MREFADTSDATPPMFYTWRNIRWMLELNADGTPAGELVDLAVPDEQARRNGRRELVPNLQRSGTKPQPMLGCDDVKNALGWTDTPRAGQSVAAKDLARAQRCHDDFVAMVEDWAHAEQNDRGAQALHAFLLSGEPDKMSRPPKYASSDLVAFRVDGEFVHLSPGAQHYWAQIALQRKTSGANGLCLVCAQHAQLIDTFPQQVTAGLIPAIGVDPDNRSKNKPQPNPVTPTSINKESMGFELTTQLTHSPICVHCAEGSVAALDLLLRGRDHSRRIGDTALAWWLLNSEPGDIAPIQLVFEPDNAAIDALLADVPNAQAPEPRQLVKAAGTIIDSPRSGRPPGEVDTRVFCAAALSANKTRLILRDWIDVPLPAAQQAVVKWFKHLSVQDPTTGSIRRFSLYRLVLACGRWSRQTNSYLPMGEPAADRPLWAQRDLLTAALHAGPLPPSLGQHLLRRLRADRRLDGQRHALLKLLLARTFHPDREIQVTLDDTDNTPAYLSGRLFAVLESLQYTATRLDNKAKKLNSTLADRYLSAASTSPARVMPELLRGSQAHLKKLRSRNRDGLATHYVKQRDELSGRIKPVPMALGLAEQCAWFNGYADQRNHFFVAAVARGQQQEPDSEVPELPDNPTDTTSN
ncbi:type I-C CRISPR-associated protein Cas8c/Csd1 [Lentzea atacamensis]|uniref:type I-C CRISPR-associated protein Cas8c/Csd1 n=1 Tax=Lentzea atacamensis TaxID=531938 RepID=UPI001473F93B|nr:type I-C CRISPR-associated protein Cas8c/Csd1 [Lentzea atacamensis]